MQVQIVAAYNGVRGSWAALPYRCAGSEAAARRRTLPSPFPGMNPYFEQKAHWLDFHTEFLSALRRLLAPQVGPKYIVQLEEHIYIHDLPPEPRQRLGTADLLLIQRERRGASHRSRITSLVPNPFMCSTRSRYCCADSPSRCSFSGLLDSLMSTTGSFLPCPRVSHSFLTPSLVP